MAGGIGDLFGGIGSIFGSIINSGNQARANNIAEQNAMMQYMLGNRNADIQQQLGQQNIDLQSKMFNQNFDLQKSTANKNYNLADLTGSDVLSLVQAMANAGLGEKKLGLATQQQGLNTQQNALGNYNQNLLDAENSGKQQVDLAKSTKNDAYGNQVYYDAATNSYKIKLDKSQQDILNANNVENLKRSTEDQQRAREGNEQNAAIRGRAMDIFKGDANDYQYGKPAVDEGALANQIYQGQNADRQSGYAALRSALATQAIRGGNSASIADIGEKVRSDPNKFFSDSANANMQAMQFANEQNRAQKQAALQGLTSAGGLATFTGDAYNDMGQAGGLDTTTQQADAGAGNLASALASQLGLVSGARGQLAQAQDAFGNNQKLFGQAQAGLGDDYNNYAATVGGAKNSRANAMINALSNGAAAQGNALQNGASAQGTAISNLASALASAYGAQASGVGSALTNQAKIAAGSKVDLSGIGKIGSGLGGLVAAMASSNGEGGTTSVNKRVF
jgi:hypothetical protein